MDHKGPGNPASAGSDIADSSRSPNHVSDAQRSRQREPRKRHVLRAPRAGDPPPRPPQPDASAGLPAEPLPGCALRPPLRDAGQRPPGHPGHEAAELTVRPPPHSRAGRGAARVRGRQCACPWKQPGTRHAPGTERLLRPLRGGLAARPGPHLGEVVLRELLLLQHGCALQRVRVDLLARDLLVLLSWKRAGSAVRGRRPVLVGTPEARPAAVERPRRAEGLRGPSPRPACTAPARGRAAA